MTNDHYRPLNTTLPVGRPQEICMSDLPFSQASMGGRKKERKDRKKKERTTDCLSERQLKTGLHGRKKEGRKEPRKKGKKERQKEKKKNLSERQLKTGREGKQTERDR